MRFISCFSVFAGFNDFWGFEGLSAASGGSPRRAEKDNETANKMTNIIRIALRIRFVFLNKAHLFKTLKMLSVECEYRHVIHNCRSCYKNVFNFKNAI